MTTMRITWDPLAVPAMSIIGMWIVPTELVGQVIKKFSISLSVRLRRLPLQHRLSCKVGWWCFRLLCEQFLRDRSPWAGNTINAYYVDSDGYVYDGSSYNAVWGSYGRRPAFGIYPIFYYNELMIDIKYLIHFTYYYLYYELIIHPILLLYKGVKYFEC